MKLSDYKKSVYKLYSIELWLKTTLYTYSVSGISHGHSRTVLNGTFCGTDVSTTYKLCTHVQDNKAHLKKKS